MATPSSDTSAPAPVKSERRPPAALRESSFARVVRGYDPAQVDQALAAIRASYDELWQERDAFERHIHELEEKLGGLEQDRLAIGDVLVHARRSAAELEQSSREQADRRRAEASTQAEAIVREAQAAADQLAREAEERMERLEEETRARAELGVRETREEIARLRVEVERLEGLEREMRAGYRAFLLAALELLEPSATAAEDGEAKAPAASQVADGPSASGSDGRKEKSIATQVA